MDIHYSAGIIITDKFRSEPGNTILPITSLAKATEFQEATRTALEKIKSLAAGAKLLSEIDRSGHVVRIVRTQDKTKGNAQFGSRVSEEMVKSFASPGKNGKTVLFDVLAKATEDLSDRWTITKFLNIGKPKPRFLSMSGISKLAGIRETDLRQMAEGKMAIPPTSEYKLRGFLYHFLEPGPGCDCYVKFNYERDNLSPEHKMYLPSTHNWRNRPVAIGLGHELIHAWRVMTGMVLYPYGWEEEAMTVGMPPFSFMEYTENKLRSEHGDLAIRPDYGIQPKTEMLKGQKTPYNDKMQWQGDDKNLAAKTQLASAMDARRRAMGFGNDNEDDDDEW